MSFQEWCIEQHRKTNHWYDEYLPYEFHLRMVAQVYEDFRNLLPPHHRVDIEMACWGHDLIEDTRTSFNDCSAALGPNVANIIYAVTNEKGKTRKERANAKYYKGIRDTEGAVFVKLCDRIANIQYSKLTKSRMFEMYKQENENFMLELGWESDHKYILMFKYLENLFNT